MGRFVFDSVALLAPPEELLDSVAMHDSVNHLDPHLAYAYDGVNVHSHDLHGSLFCTEQVGVEEYPGRHVDHGKDDTQPLANGFRAHGTEDSQAIGSQQVIDDLHVSFEFLQVVS